MKPVDSYSAINARLDRPVAKDTAVKNLGSGPDATKVQSSAISTTASKLASEKPPFDVQKVADIKQQIAAGSYRVDTENLAAKMLDAGVIGVDAKK